MGRRVLRAAIVFLTYVSASPAPCGKISDALATQGQYTPLDPDLVLQCLQSVPLEKNGDILQLEGISTWANFQSTLAYLKNPPPGYEYPAVDILGDLSKMKSDLQNGNYKSEYDFQLALYNLINVRAHDQHFQYTPDILQVFNFHRVRPLFSISEDGLQVPQVYHADDVPILVSGGKYKPSPLSSIDDEDVETFLNKIASTYPRAQDPDANYNALFPSVPLQNFGQVLDPGTDSFFSSFQGPSESPGRTTKIKFKNGTELALQNWATTEYDFEGISDGTSFFQKLCSGNEVVISSSSAASATPTATQINGVNRSARSRRSGSDAAYKRGVAVSSASISTGVSASASSTIKHSPYAAVPSATANPATPNFPSPWIFSSDLSVVCYFPDSKDNLAVLAIPTFEPDNSVEFGNVIRQCLATARKLNKKKLIIDLRGNGGGIVPDGYDMFKELFPSTQPWGTTNFRAWTLFNDIGQITSARFANATVAELGDQAFQGPFGSFFNVRNLLSTSDKAFTGWEDFYGPVHTHDDDFTELSRYNLSDRFDTLTTGITGYNHQTNLVPVATFSPADIMLLQDGQCASTCAVFAEFMKTQMSVGSVVMGGRAETGPMQGVGGVKGANVVPVTYLLENAKSALNHASPSQRKALLEEFGSKVGAIEHALTRGQPYNVEVNIRNNIRKHDSTLTPLQFVYEAANCRLFYTAKMILDQELVWDHAYDAFWNGAACVSGSTDQASSKPGTDYILHPHPGSSNAEKSPQKSSKGVSNISGIDRSVGQIIGIAAAAVAAALVI